MASVGGEETSDKNVERWKIKKLIKSLEAARGYVEFPHHVAASVGLRRGADALSRV